MATDRFRRTHRQSRRALTSASQATPQPSISTTSKRPLSTSTTSPTCRPSDGEFEVLTPRELQVLKLIAEAYTSKEIAKELVISVKTVERHRQNILDKLGMSDRVELTRYAIRRGLIQP